MHDQQRFSFRARHSTVGFLILGIVCLTIASCSYPFRKPRRMEAELKPGWPKGNNAFREASLPSIRAEIPVVEGAEYINDDTICMSCHQVYAETFEQNVHRGIHEQDQACEACHGPASRHLETRGKEPGLILNPKKMMPAQASEVCMKCHEQDACAPGAQWRTSVHAHRGVSCTDCHNAHYNVPAGTPATTEPGFAAAPGNRPYASMVNYQEPADQASLRGSSNNLGAVAPHTCYKCHGDFQEFQEIAGPHQIGGPNGFNCTTCHNPHGKILDSSRKDLCLQCHTTWSPTMAWHSSTHDLMGVSCTDCHNPHPRAAVQRFPSNAGVSLIHTNVARPKRRPMSVQEPQACYKCHPKIFAQFSLPSHHPVKEGKMFCSDCHDPHGQREGNLAADSPNLLCWKCHADKQGPFAYEHPPVTEDCRICHFPHGTVTNNLLRQPPTFLCLRCHVGHRDGTHGGGARVDIDAIPQLRGGFYTDCTQCHSQIHGSDLPTPHFPAFFR